MEELNSVQRFYAGKTIFITGGSGFMGKVLIEKLLYSCSDVREIIVLMRPKRGKTGAQRIEEFSKMPMFKRILDKKPELMQKIFPVWGEITKPNLGLSSEHLFHVINTTHIVFHLAASLKLEATLKPNIETNLIATKYVLNLAKQMRCLVQMVHTSTAFCNVDQEVMYEKVYDHPDDPEEIIKAAEWMSEEAMAAAQKEIMGYHPNTYTYTKRLAEILVRNHYDNDKLPVSIVRPSIVGPSYHEPLPGWVDSLNGPPGVIMAIGKGVLRSMLLDINSSNEGIPCDVAISALIMVVKHLASLNERPKEIPVYNVTLHESRRLTNKFSFDMSNKLRWEMPFSQSLWYPDCTLTTNKFYYQLNALLFQWIPAYFIDFLFLIFGQKRFMIRVQNKINVGMEVLKFVTMNDWKFKSDNFCDLVKHQSKEEYEMFQVDTINQGNPEEYIRISFLGGRKYLANDPPETIPRAKVQLYIQYVIDRLLKLYFVYWLVKTLLNIFGFSDVLTNALSGWTKSGA